ncbi:hypothetical protein D9613_005287 [Agrocybe pediades]|uniref:Arf-GAP domain-containing protein n=1 Tax=Agrocybe pediades TaxID=84607 RepID=A0A8H4VRS5_9AGAR|nr:hypothetical protein D9613_005287 [Agrocybe pediades]
MADQVAAKKILSELSKREDLQNKICADCNNPNPQWASLSFVRSISMDTWQDEQVKRMQIGGNLAFKEFMKSYQPADQGGYREGASPHDTYHCWAAAQYREKARRLDAALAGRDWSPSAPPANFNSGSRSASPAPSAQGLRKSRASTRTFTNRSDSQSPASSFRSSPSASGTPNIANDQKSQNEAYFASLGRANDTRSADLPPSQGGRYTGFGNTPNPPQSQNPAFGLSSANAPSLTELQENPVAAISKGWSLFAAAVAGASRVVAENVIQPGVEKVTDPNFQASVKGYMTEAQKKAAMVGSTANEWSKHQFGVDVADTVGGVVTTVKDRVAGPSRAGYGSLSLTSPNDTGESSGLYDGDDDDLFTEYHGKTSNSALSAYDPAPSTQTKATPEPAKKTSDWDDDWKDF